MSEKQIKCLVPFYMTKAEAMEEEFLRWQKIKFWRTYIHYKQPGDFDSNLGH